MGFALANQQSLPPRGLKGVAFSGASVETASEAGVEGGKGQGVGETEHEEPGAREQRWRQRKGKGTGTGCGGARSRGRAWSTGGKPRQGGGRWMRWRRTEPREAGKGTREAWRQRGTRSQREGATPEPPARFPGQVSTCLFA